jgi:hypothetical protein
MVQGILRGDLSSSQHSWDYGLAVGNTHDAFSAAGESPGSYALPGEIERGVRI